MKLPAAQFYHHAEAELAKVQRAKNKKQLGTIHAKVANRRKEALHKFSNEITRNHAVIVVGDVSSSKLAKTKMAKSLLDAGWYQFKAQLKYKAIRQSAVFIEVNEAYSTQTCSICGAIPDSSPRGRMGLEVWQWECSCCGAQHDRDINAAINILNAGLGCQSQ